MRNVKEIKKNNYEIIKNRLNFYLQHGGKLADFRKELKKDLDKKINYYNNPKECYDKDYEKMKKADPNYKKCFMWNETAKKYYIAEIEAIIEILNKYPEKIIIADNGKLEKKEITYSYLNTYNYELKEIQKSNNKKEYQLIKNIKEQTEWRINGKRINRTFIVDPFKNIILV